MIPSKATAVLMRLKEIDKKYKVKYNEQKQNDCSSENTESLIENTRHIKDNALDSPVAENREILKPTLSIKIPDACTEELESRSSTTDRISLRVAAVDGTPDDTPSEKSKSISEIEELFDDEESIAEIIDRSNFSDSGQAEKFSDKNVSLAISVENNSIKDQRLKILHHGSNDINVDGYSNDSFEEYSSDEQSAIQSQNKGSESHKEPASAHSTKVLSDNNESTNNELLESRNERQTFSSSSVSDSRNGTLNAKQRKLISLSSDKKSNSSEELSKFSTRSHTTSTKENRVIIKSKTLRSDDDDETKKDILNLVNSLHSTSIKKNSIEQQFETIQINGHCMVEKELSISFKSSHSTSVKGDTTVKNSSITHINDDCAIEGGLVNTLTSVHSTRINEDSSENHAETSSFSEGTADGQGLKTFPKSHSSTKKFGLVKKSKTSTVANYCRDEEKSVKSEMHITIDREKKRSKTHRTPQCSGSDLIGISSIVDTVDSETSSRSKAFRERRELKKAILADVMPEVKVSKIAHKPIRRARSSLAIGIRDVLSSHVEKTLSSKKKHSETSIMHKHTRSKTNGKRSKSSMLYRSTRGIEYLEPTDRELERLRTRMKNLSLEHEREFMLCYMKDFEADRQRLFLWPNRLHCPRTSKIAIIEPLDFPNVMNFTKPDTKGHNSGLPLPDHNLELLKNRVHEIRQWLKDQFILYRDYCEVAAAINAKYMKFAETDNAEDLRETRENRKLPRNIRARRVNHNEDSML